MKTITFRSSSADRILACPASHVTPSVKIVTSHPLAAMGTSVHAHLQGYSFGQWVEPSILAEQNGLNPDDWDEHAMLCAKGRRAWDSVKGWFPNPQAEIGMSHTVVYDDLGVSLTLTGHIDLWAIVEDLKEARILDWKTGYIDADHTNQMRAYAALLFAVPDFDHLETVRVAVIRVRDGTADWSTYTRDEISAWLRAAAERLSQTDIYNPSLETCRYCPRGHECEAKTAIVRAASASLMAPASAEDLFAGLPLDPEKRGPILAALLDRCKTLEAMTDQVRSLVKADVSLYGGVLPAGEKWQLEITTQRRQGISFEYGEEVLREQLGKNLGRCVTVSKTKWEKVIKDGAGRGQKGPAAMAAWEELRQASATTETIIEKLEVRKRQPKEIEEDGDSNAAATEPAAIAAGF